MVPAVTSNAAWLMAIRIMSGIWGQAALVASHRKSSGFVCGHEAGAFRCEWPPSIGRLMTTKPEAFSCATSLSATTLDMVSADCVRASALPLVKASASAVSTSRGSAGVSFSSSGMETGQKTTAFPGWSGQAGPVVRRGRHGAPRCGMTRPGRAARPGKAGAVRPNWVRFGMARQGPRGRVRLGLARQARLRGRAGRAALTRPQPPRSSSARSWIPLVVCLTAR